MPFYAFAIFLSGFLLFQVQPIIARALLPRFGGSAAVWNVCLMFFQCGLLVGYFHAFWTRRLLGHRARATVHAVLLGLSTALLPISARPATAAGPGAPALSLLLLLARTVGLPYVLLSATGPLFQDWFAARFRRDPYRLFALSNLASLAGLIAYPFAVEPHLGVAAQTRIWSWGYGVFCLVGALIALEVRSHPPSPPPPLSTGEPPSSSDPGGTADPGPGDQGAPLRRGALARWLLLPACATTLLSSVTNHLTEDVAAMPLLWVLPLSLYLATFILAFGDRRLYPRRLILGAAVVLLPGLARLRYRDGAPSLALEVGLWSAGLLVACLVLHGELSRLRPRADSLTLYYLVISTGGALGGLFVALVAPLLFPIELELEIGLVGCAALIAWTWVGDATAAADDPAGDGAEPAGAAAPRPAHVLDDPARRLALSACWTLGIAVTLVLGVGERSDEPRLAMRNFYGPLRVVDIGEGPQAIRKLIHGHINHGAQRTAAGRSMEPTTYYCPESGIGLVFSHLPPERPRNIGVIGLGAGSLAVYGRAGDHLRFFEINPLVERIARSQFSYLGSSPAAVDVALGDARLTLAADADSRFDVLALDAFSGDAIPVHLLTREAIALYLRHLTRDGVLAVHISNKHLDLTPVLADAAARFRLQARVVESDDDDDRYCFVARWVLLTRDPALPAALDREEATTPKLRPGFRPWTDDYSNLVSVMR